MNKRVLTKREFLKSVAAGCSLGTVSNFPRITFGSDTGRIGTFEDKESKIIRPYDGPNIVIIRFGGGVRRRESIDPTHTFAPFTQRIMGKLGTTFTNMYYDSEGEAEVGHGQGTLNILTGLYSNYKDVNNKFLGEGYESDHPTLFEHMRKEFDLPTHQTLIINGEDRTQEEFYSFSNHHLFGVKYKSEVLSLYRYKLYLLEKKLSELATTHPDYKKVSDEVEKMRQQNYRSGASFDQTSKIISFWEKWESFYGRSGLKNPRGDRLLTELSSWALRRLKPRMMMINYNDPDYIHWGYMAHYTKAISIIDQGIRRIYEQCQADEFYRDNTIFAIVPDCGRETNPFVKVPCQHHFNSRSSREIFGILVGPGIAKDTTIDRKTEQISVAKTISTLSNFNMQSSDAEVLEESIA